MLPCNLVSGNNSVGIILEGTKGRAEGNLIGTDVSGTSPLGNTVGVSLGGEENVVGATPIYTPPAGVVGTYANVISGNQLGIQVSSSGSRTTTIAANYIGTDITGESALGNSTSGIHMTSPGYTVILGNTISGNGENGIRISDIAFNEAGRPLLASVIENHIGVSFPLARDRPNGEDGIKITNVTGATIEIGEFYAVPQSGFDRPNLIASNAGNGIFVEDFREGVLWIANNDIYSNSGSGVYVNRSDNITISNNKIRSHPLAGITLVETTGSSIRSNTIGFRRGSLGAEPASNENGVEVSRSSDIGIGFNSIWFNRNSGVLVDEASTGISISHGSMHANGGLGIDLNGDGVTLNDDRDPDSGANELQNYPILVYAATDGTRIVVIGKLNSTPNSYFNIDLYRSRTNNSEPSPAELETCDSSGFGEGEVSATTRRMRTYGARGNGWFSATLRPPAEGEALTGITATATDAGGNTSEFSACIRVIDSVTMTMMGVRYSDMIDLVVAADGLTEDAGFSLLNKLDAALGYTQAQEFEPAIIQLKAFNYEIEGLGATQQLDPKTVQTLTDQVNQIIQLLDGSTPPPSATSVTATAGNSEIYPGDLVNVSLDIQNADNLYAIQTSCVADPMVLVGQNTEFGSFFDAASRFIAENSISGGIWNGAVSLLSPAMPLTGNGNYATLTYKGAGPGTASISCSGIMSDQDGNELDSNYVGTSVTVLPFASLNGIAVFQGRSVHSGIDVTAAGVVARSAVTDVSGAFLLDELKAGTYDIRADAQLYLPNCTSAGVTPGQLLALSDTVLRAGDADDDDAINIGDATLVAANFRQAVPPGNALADINGDGVVNIRDLALLGSNYGRSGCQVW